MTFTALPSPNPLSNSLVKDFRDYVHAHHRRHIHDGVDQHGRTRRFVCGQGLASFWTSKRITSALGLEDVPLLSDFFAMKTKKSYIKVLSTLCYTGFPGAILSLVVNDGLSDADLPVSPVTHDNLNSQNLPFDLPSFYQSQWIFMPVIFRDGTHKAQLPADQILPISHQEQLEVKTGMGSTKIYKVTLHPCCNRLPTNEVVFKTVKANVCHNLGSLWEKEAAAYAKIFQKSPHIRGGRQNPHHSRGITRCFGSYAFAQAATAGLESETQNCEEEGKTLACTHFIVLEHATAGTLEDFLSGNTALISSLRWEDQRSFWCQLFNILVGLQELADLNLTHQDIKRSNFLDVGTDLSDINNCRFKQADFGTAVDGDALGDDERSRRCSFGNHNHMAPECIGGPKYPQLPRPQPFTSQADIWALGCVLTDILVQCRLGKKRMEEYEPLREKEIESSKKPIRGSPWRNGFHDGVNRLACVDEMHREALKGCPKDSVLHLVSRIILDMMLQPIEIRRWVSAGEIRAAWLKGLERLEKKRRDLARSHLVVVRRAASLRTPRDKAPAFFNKQAIVPCPPPSILGTLFMPVRCEASERLQPLLDRKTVPICNITSISLTLVHLATLAIAITRSRNCINHDSLSHISGTLQAPYRQSLNRHLENVLFMLLVWLGYELIIGD